MLLLDKENVVTDSARKIIILSEREEIQTHVAQLLRTRGLERIEIVEKDFLTDDDMTFNAEETVGIIADIHNASNVKVISERVNAVVPQHIWCCLIGTCDSISIAQKLLNKSILYFNSDSQLIQMAERIISAGVSIPQVRNTIKVCVLGCKGGIGASFISSHIASNIAATKKVPILLAQGSNGSQDLDLLFDKKVQDIVEYESNLHLFKGEPQNLDVALTEKYNFIIYDQPIFNVHPEQFASFIDYSNNFVLVVERRISSLRVAKQFLEQCDRISGTTGKAIRTFICISDSSLETSKLMARTDIESLLGCPVDAVIPFLKQTESRTVLSVKLPKEGQTEINSLAMKVLGTISRTTFRRNKKKSSLWTSILDAFK
ncbi:pilus assembly protein [Lonepinella sp. MS14436]|uniref:pilus assembly protein n=1 Tax=Lonepinella sp. MS14436 TaxID=3003619 RepID=UPI0036DADC24